MTLLVRDEADIVATHLDYHLGRGVDHVVVTDNRSTDGTPEIVEQFVAAGLATLLHEHDDTYAQGRWVTRMAHLAADQLAAEWVLHLDADEFVWPRKAGDIPLALAEVPTGDGWVEISRLNFVPRSLDDRPAVQRQVHRQSRPTNLLGRPIPPKVAHRAVGGVVVAQGNHAVEGRELGPRSATRPLEIFHYPLRSYEHFERTIRNGGAAYKRNTELAGNVGSTWRRMYELLDDGLLRDRFLDEVVDDEHLQEALDGGALVFDPRLRDYFDAVEVSAQSSDSPAPSAPSVP